MLRLKRAYEPRARGEGRRVLVDRLWPRGVSKERLAIDEWMKDIAPSSELRRWFAHDPTKWLTFQRRYERELKAHTDLIDRLATSALEGRVTLIFGAKDASHNDAVCWPPSSGGAWRPSCAAVAAVRTSRKQADFQRMVHR
jgi:uncharacterized protein YeaO (DUF488 family)